MKNYRLIFMLFCVTFYSSTYAQVQDEKDGFDQFYKERVIKYNYFWNTMKLNDEVLHLRDRRSIMMTYPESERYYRQSTNLNIVSTGMAVGSLTAILLSMNQQRRAGDLYNPNKDGWMFANMGLCVGVLILDNIAKAKVRKAVNAYNKEVMRELW